MSSEVAARPLPRRGRFFVALLLALGLGALGYAIVTLSTQERGDDVVHLAGISDAQGLFGGVPQEGDRLGSSDAPVTVQVFNDMQCADCRDDFLSTIPELAERYARPGDVQFLYRHYSNSINTQQLGFYGAEAAADQGYGWQYVYLFFRNQDEAEKFGVDQKFLASVAGGVEELDLEEWDADLERNGGSGGEIDRRLEGYEELARGLGIRKGQGMVVNGPSGTRTLQEGPSLAEVEAAIAEVQ
ncbi:MAG TPA: thioredoxin domain-containing protein [Solirubrobacterales bacterium]|nr:thioredoxin domain-containing protein [Solirubrobacterales bacterium]